MAEPIGQIQEPISQTPVGKRAIVIGAGFGGLAAAIRLQAQGIQTTLIDNRDKAGGRAYVYHENGYVFDGGPTVITDPTALEALFACCGRRLSDYVTLLPVDPFYRLCWEDGYSFDYVNDTAQLEAQIALKSPRDVEGYRKLYRYTKDVFREGYLKLGAVPFLSFRTMVGVSPQLLRLQAFRSVYAKVSSFIRDEQLRQAFSFHSLLVGGNPFTTSSIYTLIHALEREWGVWFAKGGTGALIQGLVQLFEDMGGELRLSSPVSEILTRHNQVTGVLCENGWQAQCDLLVSNADVVHTYDALLRQHPRGQRYSQRLKRKRFSMSLFVIYFGLRAQHPQLQHHTVLFGQRYRELLSEIFAGPELPEDFSLYLHAPSVTDESLAPPGCSAYYVLAPVPHLGAADVDWEAEAPKYRDRILQYLEEHYIPNLRRDLDVVRVLTPVDFKEQMNAHLGSAFSIEPRLTQSAWFRPHNRDAVISNLYLVGAGTHPGAGIPGVVGSAKATCELIAQDLQTAETSA